MKIIKYKTKKNKSKSRKLKSRISAKYRQRSKRINKTNLLYGGSFTQPPLGYFIDKEGNICKIIDFNMVDDPNNYGSQIGEISYKIMENNSFSNNISRQYIEFLLREGISILTNPKIEEIDKLIKNSNQDKRDYINIHNYAIINNKNKKSNSIKQEINYYYTQNPL